MRCSLALILALAACGSASNSPGATATDSVIDLDAVELQAGKGTLSGMVVQGDAGPVSLAAVRVARAGGEEAIAEAVTDVSGAYSISNLVPGAYDVYVSHGERSARSADITIRANQTTKLSHRFEEAPAAPSSATREGPAGSDSQPASKGALGHLVGRLVDATTKKPFGGVTVIVSADHLTQMLFTIAGDDGSFEFRGLTPAIYTVSIYYSLVDKGHVEVRRSGIVVQAGKATELSIELDTEARK